MKRLKIFFICMAAFTSANALANSSDTKTTEIVTWVEFLLGKLAALNPATDLETIFTDNNGREIKIEAPSH